MVRNYNARLTLLHVVEIPINSYGSQGADIAFDSNAFDDKMFKIGQRKLSNFREEHFDDLAGPNPVATVYDRGDPGHAIVAQDKARGADLIMMPTHGHGAFHNFLLGSTRPQRGSTIIEGQAPGRRASSEGPSFPFGYPPYYGFNILPPRAL